MPPSGEAGTPPPPAPAAGAAAAHEKVWVGVRIRPLLRHELDAGERAAWHASAADTLTCTAAAEDGKPVHQQNSYCYNRVFGDATTSEEVYAQSTRGMVLSAMEGYNCTIFAYGQTGAGKTTTMRSIMRLAAKDVFQHIGVTARREFVLKLQAIEVYNEMVHDLFAAESGSDGGTGSLGSNLKIQDDPERGPVVENLTEHSIESEEHLSKMLKAVEARRLVRAAAASVHACMHAYQHVYTQGGQGGRGKRRGSTYTAGWNAGGGALSCVQHTCMACTPGMGHIHACGVDDGVVKRPGLQCACATAGRETCLFVGLCVLQCTLLLLEYHMEVIWRLTITRLAGARDQNEPEQQQVPPGRPLLRGEQACQPRGR